ncbi:MULTISPECIES: hypothetical protein [Ramlibacter]|uniref:Uncharacterized protein n=1 Tax=Ramlibacter aquaticus TaxID=2780094 RepID=A0ABR9S9J3_9BURK|nr:MULTISPECIES: hypothetical protein [Ramlibacter]MBE7938975.1 hypothetical protein [Ramlibacter aquaticus]
MRPSRIPLLKIQRVPGDPPRAMEQIDGDLLVPAQARPVLERLLRTAVQGLPPGEPERLALVQACVLLGVEPGPAPQSPGSANLLKVRPI